MRDLEPRDSAFVLIYDPKDLAEIQLDAIRRAELFEQLVVMGENDVILLASEKRSERVTIQTSRLEFVQAVKTPFEERTLDDFEKLLRSLPELSVKSFGLNYTLSFSVESQDRGALFLRDRFLKQPTGFEGVLGNEIISNSTRMIFGQMDHYRDVRFAPLSLDGSGIILQYHFHRDEALRDRERIVHLLRQHAVEEVKTVSQLVSVLP